MSTYTLKSVVQRGTMLGAAFALVAAVFAPLAPSTYADALNPLTDRSLTLSSSAPGWDYLDGSGNATYAVPNSGANGQKTGNTFSFKVSTDSSVAPAIKAFSFQYCTYSAGLCRAPGDGNDATHSNLAVVTDEDVDQISSATWDIIKPGGTGRAADPAEGIYNGLPKLDSSEGNFVVLVNDTYSAGWVMQASNKEDPSDTYTVTGQNNYITLVNTTGINPAAGDSVKVIFFATNTNYITNPGSGAFFVKINSYSAFTQDEEDDPYVLSAADIIDGGVTVANVMNRSIQIQTKVLETMDFSVGTVDPYTLDSTGGEGSQLHTANGNEKHGVCDRILTRMSPTDPVNVLKMGSEAGEFSLETDKTYSTHSYWRLSSNSSAGATVYYSGVTLSNTVGDKIAPMSKTKEAPLPGKEQFGLALANATSGDRLVDYSVERLVGVEEEDPTKLYEWGADNGTNGIHETVEDDIDGNPSYHAPRLAPLVAKPDYNQGAGVVNANFNGTQAINTAFAFDEDSNTVPTPIADETSQVVDCVTGKMRYVANIAATTPAGIYTTKINYIAAPQY